MQIWFHPDRWCPHFASLQIHMICISNWFAFIISWFSSQRGLFKNRVSAIDHFHPSNLCFWGEFTNAVFATGSWPNSGPLEPPNTSFGVKTSPAPWGADCWAAVVAYLCVVSGLHFIYLQDIINQILGNTAPVQHELQYPNIHCLIITPYQKRSTNDHSVRESFYQRDEPLISKRLSSTTSNGSSGAFTESKTLHHAPALAAAWKWSNVDVVNTHRDINSKKESFSKDSISWLYHVVSLMPTITGSNYQ